MTSAPGQSRGNNVLYRGSCHGSRPGVVPVDDITVIQCFNCHSEYCHSEVCPGQVCTGQVCPGQVCPGQACPGQVCSSQVCPGQICPDDVCEHLNDKTSERSMVVLQRFARGPEVRTRWRHAGSR